LQARHRPRRPTIQPYPPAQVQQLVIQAALNPDEQEEEQTDEEEDEVFMNTEDMTEDKTIGPGTFSGTTGEDGDRWLKHFEHYCAYKGYPEAKQPALCKVLLTGSAGHFGQDKLNGKFQNQI